jgi:hypothetical protein
MEKALFILKPCVSSSRHIVAATYSSDLSKRITRQELAQIELLTKKGKEGGGVVGEGVKK